MVEYEINVMKGLCKSRAFYRKLVKMQRSFCVRISICICRKEPLDMFAAFIFANIMQVTQQQAQSVDGILIGQCLYHIDTQSQYNYNLKFIFLLLFTGQECVELRIP